MREYLISMREHLNESQQDVAKALGISRQYYAMIENGQRQKSMDIMVMAALASHFGVPVAEIAAEELKTTKGGTCYGR